MQYKGFDSTLDSHIGCAETRSTSSLPLKLKVQNAQGFTLVELIMVIVIVGILATMTTDIITLPVKSYIDLERRTTLVDSAEMTLRRMQRDIRQALPNSIRITGGGTAIELLHTTDGGRYRAKLASDSSGDILDFTGTEAPATNDSFDVIGSLNSSTTGGEIVIYNLGSTGANAYASTNKNRETISGITNTSGNYNITLNSAILFPFQSPHQRFFIVDTPITYSCAGGELRRYDNYAISSAAPGLGSLSYNLQAKTDTLNCTFSYNAGTATRGGLVTLEITLTDEAGESARLVHQIHVDNMP